MPDTINTNGWSQYEKLVLSKLDELKTVQDQHTAKLETLTVSHATMKAEATRDAKWISGVGAFLGLLVSSGVHIFWRK
jgi:hypothetical protein